LARRLIIAKLRKTTSKGDATTVATKNLGGAGMTMDETVERVRGALRKAADVLKESSTNTENPADSDGGKGL
jgi:hypothetical protein